ncbi:MAG: peptide chain release factor N(5)-glutamine methyltransferase [Anaerolineae bacterium]|nr:peptide chain release factor N(5)-glutamine methyltransferase [Anaerolineae bacterium]
MRSILETAVQRLAQAQSDTPRLDAEVLLAHALHKDRAWLYTHSQAVPPSRQISRFHHLLTRRVQQEPVAYLIGHKEFFGLDFQVNRRVLIPRPETELLVETAIHIAAAIKGCAPIGQPGSAPSSTPLSIADIGTGSGCIAIALAKHLAGVSVVAVDRSPEALQVARQNAARHGVADRISWVAGDLLQPLVYPFALIVSNPPYVSPAELAAAPPEVSRYEPRPALDGGRDGLDLIRRLLAQAPTKLAPGGSLLIEIGAGQGAAAAGLAGEYFPQAHLEIKKDLAGLDRLLVLNRESD